MCWRSLWRLDLKSRFSCKPDGTLRQSACLGRRSRDALKASRSPMSGWAFIRRAVCIERPKLADLEIAMSNETVGQGTVGTDQEEFEAWARQLGVEPGALRNAVLAVG